MSQNTITLKLTRDQENTLYEAWASSKAKTPPYARWQLRPENCVITCYTSGKTVFQGRDALVYASPFIKDAPASADAHTSQQKEEILPQAGSDEVGTGDYFGPVVVCAAAVDAGTSDALHKLGVRDSKAVDDTSIRTIGPEILKIVPHALLVLSPAKYNEVHRQYNINAIKAMMHNQAYIDLAKKTRLPSFKMVDQFAPPSAYYSYLRNVPEVVNDLHFQTKAEDDYISVGTASILARYAFLTYWDRMEEKYDMSFHKGAGADTDRCAQAFVDRYGMDRLCEVAKLHFANTKHLHN